MDFGLVGPEDVAPSQVAEAEAETTKQQIQMGLLGSGLGKQERSAGSLHDDWAGSKMARTDDFGSSITMSLHHGTSLLRSNSILSDDHGAAHAHHHRMLSFSSPKSDLSFLRKDGGLLDRPSKPTAFPYYQPTPTPSPYDRNAGISHIWGSMEWEPLLIHFKAKTSLHCLSLSLHIIFGSFCYVGCV